MKNWIKIDGKTSAGGEVYHHKKRNDVFQVYTNKVVLCLNVPPDRMECTALASFVLSRERNSRTICTMNVNGWRYYV